MNKVYYYKIIYNEWQHNGYHLLVCRSAGQAIDPAPWAQFIPKFISLAQVISI